MKKPGIYSDKYGKTKRRLTSRRNLRLALAGLVLFLLFFLPYLNGKVKEFHAAGDTFPSQTVTKAAAQSATQAGNTQVPATMEVTTPVTTPATTPVTQASTAPVTQPAGSTAATQPAATPAPVTAPAATAPPSTAAPAGPLSAGYTLTNGSAVIIQYEQMAPGETKFLSVSGADGQYTFDISPSGKLLLLNETADQNLILIGADLKAVDRSFNTYNYAGTGKLRRDVYNKRDNFIWMRNARFFTEDLILFESQVALAMKPMYIWSYVPSAHKFKLVEGTRSTTAQLVGLTPAGFEVKLDGKTVHLNENLEVVP